jgi:hypothetical protein
MSRRPVRAGYGRVKVEDGATYEGWWELYHGALIMRGHRVGSPVDSPERDYVWPIGRIQFARSEEAPTA